MSPKLAVVVISAWVPALAAAQVPIQLPKALIFPNYDNVLLGKDQALEGGAYVARTRDASANFYNPAGLVQSEKTSLNASSTGWVQTRITSDALNTSVTSSKIDNVPGYFGAVLDPPLIGGHRNFRMGVSFTRLVSFAPGSLDQELLNPGQGFDRLTYSSSGSFITQLYQIAAAWAPAPSRSLRLGASLGLANTSYNSEATLSGKSTGAGGELSTFLANLRAGGNEWDMVFGAGVQWDVVAGLTVGATVRTPGLRLGASAVVTYESSQLTGATATNSYFRDDAGRFEYRLPLAVGLGIAYDFGDAQLEGDLRYHDSVGPYDFYTPSKSLESITTGSSTPAQQGLPPFSYEARRVWNAAIGGNVRIARIATLHGGFYTSLSPVRDASTSPLRKADLYGFTAGVDVQLDRFGASLGAGYQFGTSPTTGVGLGDLGSIQASSLKLQAISILYAISFTF
jgi:hypothetical protein